MRLPDPDWYAALKDGPLRRRMFTPELAARIREEAVRGAREQAGSHRRLLWFGSLAACLAAFLLIAVHQDRLTLPGSISEDFGYSSPGQGHPVTASGGGHDAADGPPRKPAEADGGGTEPEGRTAVHTETGENGESAEDAGTEGGTGADESGSSADAVASDQTDGRIQYTDHGKTPILKVSEPSLEEWQLLIDALKPGRESVVLDVEAVGADKKRRLILSRQLRSAGGALFGDVRVDEVEWGVGGWRNWASVSHVPGDNLMDTDARVITGWFGIGPQDKSIDIFMGFLLDPEIVSMRVRDHRNEVYEAKLFHETEGVRIWYAHTPEQPRGRYVIEGLDANGNIVFEEPLNGPDVVRFVPPEE